MKKHQSGPPQEVRSNAQFYNSWSSKMTTTFVQPNAVTAPWFAVMQGLAGAAPRAFWGPENADTHPKIREDLKAQAAHWLAHYAEPMGPQFRAPYWVLHAYAHWWRAWLPLHTQWAADVYDEQFPNGIDFRRYLGAWLWSVGSPKLGMTPADLEAVHAMTGVAALPHVLLPIGFSEFRQDYISTTEVDKVPAAKLTLEAILEASNRSKL